MNKLLKKFISIVTLSIVTIILSSCDLKDLIFKHEHEWEEKYSYVSNQHWLECKDEECDERINVGEHVYEGDWILDEEPTHFQVGFEKKVCIVCGYEYKRVIPKTPHTLKLVEGEPATCTQSGKMDHYTCTECRDWFMDAEAKEEIPFNYEGLVIKPTGHHYDENSYNLVLPTKEEEGYIEFKCDNCEYKYYPTIKLGIPNQDFNLYTTLSFKDASCIEEGHTIYGINKEYVKNLLLSNDIPSEKVDIYLENFEKDGLFNEEYKYIFEKTPHKYELKIKKDQTVDQDGEIQVVCSECNGIALNNDGKETTILPAYSNELYQLLAKEPTCFEQGYNKYSLSNEKFLEYVKTNYSDNIKDFNYLEKSYTEGFSHTEILEINEHVYKANVKMPTLKENGTIEIKCENCDKYLTNTYTYRTIIPCYADPYYGSFTDSSTCDEAGIITYTLDKEKVYEFIAADFGLEIEDVAPYLDDLLVDIEVEGEPIGHLYKSGTMILGCMPTLDEEGKIYFPCDRENCDHYRELEEGLNYLPISSITDRQDFKTKTTTSTCNKEGIVTVILKDNWLETKLKQYFSDYKTYLANDTITEQIQKIEMKDRLVDHDLLFTYDAELHLGIGKCRYEGCELGGYEITLPDYDSEAYRVGYTVSSTCSRNGYESINLKKEYAEAVVAENEQLIAVFGLEVAASNLANSFSYHRKLPLDYTVHEGNYVYNEFYNHQAPYYSKTSHSFVNGYMGYSCSGCGGIKKVAITRSMGVYEYTNSAKTAYRIKYTYQGHVLYSDPITHFYYQVDYGEGNVSSSYAVTYYEVGINENISFNISSSHFRLNGKELNGYEVYVDGEKYTNLSNYYGRAVKTGISSPSLTVYFNNSNQYSNEKFIGHVYVKIIY